MKRYYGPIFTRAPPFSGNVAPRHRNLYFRAIFGFRRQRARKLRETCHEFHAEVRTKPKQVYELGF